MKRTMGALACWAVFSALAIGMLGPAGGANVAGANGLLEDLARRLTTPESISSFIWRHFRFENDRVLFGREDYWQSPVELLETQRGDCEDFALFAYEILKRNGKSPLLVNLYGSGSGHTICVFKEKGKCGAIDGTFVIRNQTSNLRELLSKINPFWKKASIVVPSPLKQPRILGTFRRTD